MRRDAASAPSLESASSGSVISQPRRKLSCLRRAALLDAAPLWARSPKLFLGVAVLYGAIDRRSSPLEPALRSILTVRVSQINHCRFCVDINAATLLRRGIGEDKLRAPRGLAREQPIGRARARRPRICPKR
jgi:AhpD family alkylhydroperoxidase